MVPCCVAVAQSQDAPRACVTSGQAVSRTSTKRAIWPFLIDHRLLSEVAFVKERPETPPATAHSLLTACSTNAGTSRRIQSQS
jgi:hypothetical protein